MRKNIRSGMLMLATLALFTSCKPADSVKEEDSAKPVDTTKDDTTPKSDFDKNQKIIAYTRDTNSGTREGFMEKIGLKAASKSNDALKEGIQQTTGNGDMLEQLSKQEYGIGYFSFDSKKQAEEKGLKLLKFASVEATEDSIIDGSYKLARNFNYCVATELTGAKKTIVDAFVAFMSTSDGLTTIKANGGVCKITPKTKSWADIKSQFAGIEDDHKDVTINFGGSTSVEKIARALSAQFSALAGNFKANHNHTGSGSAYTGTQGDSKGTLDIAFASREFHTADSEPLAEGSYGKVCVDGIVIGVSNKNPLDNISADEVKSIYDKTNTTVSKWADIIK